MTSFIWCLSFLYLDLYFSWLIIYDADPGALTLWPAITPSLFRGDLSSDWVVCCWISGNKPCSSGISDFCQSKEWNQIGTWNKILFAVIENDPSSTEMVVYLHKVYWLHYVPLSTHRTIGTTKPYKTYYNCLRHWHLHHNIIEHSCCSMQCNIYYCHPVLQM